MTDPKQTPTEATAVVEAVAESAKQAVKDAAEAAAQINKPNDVEYLAQVLRDVLEKGKDQGKYVDVGRIPFICQDIRTVKEQINEIHGNISWVVKLIVGAVILAALTLIFKA